MFVLRAACTDKIGDALIILPKVGRCSQVLIIIMIIIKPSRCTRERTSDLLTYLCLGSKLYLVIFGTLWYNNKNNSFKPKYNMEIYVAPICL